MHLDIVIQLCFPVDGSGEHGHQTGEQLAGWVQEAAAKALQLLLLQAYY